MTKIPVFCNNCGAIFPSGINLEGHATFFGNRAGPCPRCGSMGHIPDGVFNFIGNTIEILSAPERTIDELNLLAKILRDTQEKRLNQEEIAARVKQELPSLSRLTQLLPTNRSELYGFLMLVLVVIQLLTQSQQTKPPVSTITVNQVVQAVYVQSTASAQQPYKGIGKTGRNDLCPCGSGKKYKKCCGAAQ